MIDAAELGYTPANLHGGLFLSVQLKKSPKPAAIGMHRIQKITLALLRQTTYYTHMDRQQGLPPYQIRERFGLPK